MKKVAKIILIIGICLSMVGLGYLVTKYLDKNLYLNTELLVTFEDTKEFNLESTLKFDEDKIDDLYPNKFTVENKSLKNVNYNIIIKEIDSNIEKDNLNYILYLNDKEVKKGNVADIKEILYTSNIKILKKDYYKLYIYLNKEIDDPKYTYTLEITSK